MVAHVLEAAGRTWGTRRPPRELGAGEAARIADGLARDLERLRGTELADVTPDDWRAAVELLRACLAAAAPLDESVALDASLRPEGLESIIRERGRAVLNEARLGLGARFAFDLLLATACARLLDT